MFSGFFRVVSRGRVSSLPSCGWTAFCLSGPLLTDAGSLPLWAVASSTAVSVGLQESAGRFQVFLGPCLGAELLGHRGIPC